jgi:hypothetical protein
VAKRFAISPIIGTGSDTNPFRPAVADVPQTNTNGVIPSKPDGTPKYRFALCVVGTLNLPAVLAVSNAYVFPDYPLDATLAGMDADKRAGMVQSVHAYDLDGAGLHLTCPNADGDSYRDAILSLIQQMEPAFASLNTFDTSEPAS